MADDQNGALASMKKLFKNPAAAAKGSVKDMVKGIKKVFSQGEGTSQFMYKSEFAYSDGTGPMIFIGAPAGDWKKFVKDHKKDADFAAGYCKLEATDEGLKLSLQVKMGKGGKAPMLKAINKELMRKANATAVFVDELEMHMEDDDKEDIHGDDTTAHIEDSAHGGDMTPVQQLSYDFKSILTNYKAVRDAEHDIDEVKDLYKDLQEWVTTLKGLPKEEQVKLKAYVANYKKILDGVKKVMKADEHIDDEIAKVTELVHKFVAIPDHSSDEAKKIATDASGVIAKIEKFAQFVGANDLLEQCTVLKDVLAH